MKAARRMTRVSCGGLVLALLGACGMAEPPAGTGVEAAEPAWTSEQPPSLPKPDLTWEEGIKPNPDRNFIAFPVSPETPPHQSPESDGYPRPCADVFDDDHLPTYEIEMDRKEWRAFQSDARNKRKVYRPITFKYEGEVFPDAMMRWKGNNSSCKGKLQFTIAFHKIDKRGRFQGMRRISLDHGGCHLFEERLAMSFARDLGIPALCINHARLFVNGEYQGLFVNQEVMNKDFLKRNFIAHDGNLYKKGKELKTNEEDSPDTSAIDAYWAATELEELEALIDLDHAVQFWALEAVMPAQDNYLLYNRNFFLYDHPLRGFLFLPYDYDQGMPSRPDSSMRSSIWPSFHHPANIVLSHSEWRDRYREEVKRIARAYDPEKLDRRLIRWWEQVREANAADPDFVYTDSRFEALRQSLYDRSDYLERYRED